MSTQSNENNSDFMAPPWWKAPVDDYTQRRTGDLGYTMNDLIGRKDVNKYKLVTSDPATVGAVDGNLIT